MKPTKIKIPGSYYDSQIYSGRLYLWCTDNSILVLNWDKLIESVPVEKRLKLALACAFKQSDYLYRSYGRMLFEDEEIRSVITSKFEDLAQSTIEFNKEQIQQAEIKHQDNPLPFLHTDLTIYNEKLYISGRAGVFQTTCNKKNKYPISRKAIKKWDAPALGLSAAYRMLNISAGDEGLFELGLADTFEFGHESSKPSQISTLHSSASNWLYYSVFNASHVDAGCLLDYEKIQPKGTDEYGDYTIRNLRRVVSINEIFGSAFYTWGNRDKICQVNNNTIKVAQYFPWKNENERLINLGELEIMSHKGEVVSGNTAIYGVIIECDYGLIVLDSNLNNFWIEGEPINWRIFPRSKFYENHLHVIFEDCIDIYSFNNDYFIDQNQKKAGFIAPFIENSTYSFR